MFRGCRAAWGGGCDGGEVAVMGNIGPMPRRTGVPDAEPSSRVAVMKVDTAGRNEPLRRLAQILETSGRTVATEPDAQRRFYAAKFDATRFFAKLPASLPKPRISAAEDGEVVVEWIGHNRRAVVEFEGDDHFGYALLQSGRFIGGQHAGDLQAPDLPRDLLQYLGELTATRGWRRE